MAERRCTDCGAVRIIAARGKCRTCYSNWHRSENGRKPLTYTVECVSCSTRFEASKDSVRFCSQACQNAARLPEFHITCEHCGNEATMHVASARFCSEMCRRWSFAGRPNSTAVVPWVKPKYVPTPPQNPPGFNWTVIVNGPCHRCGEQFTAAVPSTASLARFCSTKCSRAHAKAKRRAVKRNAYVADVSPTAIFERDCWTCQLCRRKVDRTKSAPHPKSPTIDHIVPLGAGGTHEPSNAQCAHFLCNSIKGDRGTDQLRLIG